METKCTIIITNYNYGKWVAQSIRSAMNQTHKSHVCVIDDGSSDNSWSIIKSELEKDGEVSTALYESKLPCYMGPIEVIRLSDSVTALRITNSGASTARNVGIHYMWNDSDFFGILDADDEYYKDKVEKLLIPMQDRSVGVVYADYMIRKITPNYTYDKIELKEPYSREILLKRCIVHSGSLIKKTFLQQVVLDKGEFFDSKLHGPLSKGFIGCTEDYDLWLRLCKYCMFIHVPEVLSLVRETGQNQSYRMTGEIFAQNAEIMKR